jgi:hypothetical protein
LIGDTFVHPGPQFIGFDVVDNVLGRAAIQRAQRFYDSFVQRRVSHFAQRSLLRDSFPLKFFGFPIPAFFDVVGRQCIDGVVLGGRLHPARAIQLVVNRLAIDGMSQRDILLCGSDA